jgi:drug/metabolite transporter (DMT)-like permease
MIFFITVPALFAITYTLNKIMLTYAPPFFVIGIRMLISGTLLTTYFYQTRKTLYRLTKYDYWLYMQLAFFGIFLFYSTRSIGLRYVSSGKTAVFFCLAPIIMHLLQNVSHRAKRYLWLGIGVGFCALIPLFLHLQPADNTPWMISSLRFAECILLFSVIAFSYAQTISIKLEHQRNFAPLASKGLSKIIGGSLAMSTSLLFEARPVENWYIFIGLIIFQIFLSNVLCEYTQKHVTQKHGPVALTFSLLLTPLFVMVYGYLLFNEPFDLNIMIAWILCVIGASVSYNHWLIQQIRVFKKSIKQRIGKTPYDT